LDQLLGAKLGQVELLGDRPDNVFLGHGSDAPAAFSMGSAWWLKPPKNGRKTRRKPRPDKH
jgi:hypothetical protein